MRQLLVACIAAALFLIGTPNEAAAEWEPSGSVSLHGLINGNNLGAGVLVDVVQPLGVLRLGGVVGLAAISSDDAESSRVLMPFGVSVALHSKPLSGFGFGAQVRGGGWGGATDAGLGAGGWLATGGLIEYAFDPRVALGAGVDAWFLWGQGNMSLVSPFVSLMWTMEEELRDESVPAR